MSSTNPTVDVNVDQDLQENQPLQLPALRHFFIDGKKHPTSMITTNAWCVLLLGLITVPAVIIVNHMESHTSFITSFEPNRTIALSDAVFAPFTAAVVNLAIQQACHQLPGDVYQFHPAMVLGPLAVSGRQVVDYGVSNEHAWTLHFYDKILGGLVLYVLWKLTDWSIAMANESASAIAMANDARAVTKMHDIMKGTVTTKDHQKDMLYTHSSPKDYDAPQLLSQWWGIGTCVFKLYMSIAYICVLWGFEDTAMVLISLIYGPLVIGAFLAAAVAVQAMPGISGLFYLAMHRPFYIGEIVNLSTSPGIVEVSRLSFETFQ